MDYQFHPYPKKKRRKKRDIGSKSLAREKAWQAFSLYIRMRDGNRCLMGEMYGGCNGYIQAGHVIPKERAPRFYFDEEDTFAQCSRHNRDHRYNNAPYVTWYIETFGLERWKALERRSRIPGWKDYTIEELRRIKSHYEHKLLGTKSVPPDGPILSATDPS